MEPRVCRFLISRSIAEAIFAVGAGLLASFALLASMDPDGPRMLLLVPALGLLPFLLLLRWGRWRSYYVIDDRGVEFRRSARWRVTRLDWEEVEELFLLDWPGFELRGAGKRIRVRGPYEGLHHARSLVAPRLTRLREHLQARALGEGQVVFRMPGGTWKAHLAYLGAVMVLTALSGLCLAPLIKGRLLGYPLVLFFAGGWLWSLRRKASLLGTRVILRPGGFEIRRLDRRDRVAWADFDRPEWNGKDGLDLILKSQRVISLPAALGNLALLEEYLREVPPRVDSSTPGGAESRTMMQSF